MKIKNTETRILCVVPAYPPGACGGFVGPLDHPCVQDGAKVLLERQPVSWFRIRTARSEPLCSWVGWQAEFSAFWVGWCVTVTSSEEVFVSCFPSQACVISVIENPGLWLGLDSASNQTQALLPT